MKVIKRFLSVLLVMCMIISLAPMTTLADTTSSTDSTEETQYRILHLDCGRKYFTKDWIIALINEMDAAGYTHLELAFGNDGLRFLLDDMAVGSYSDDAVTAAIKAGNESYYDAGDVNELTQSEMDDIIAHAESVGIEIIPLLNTPGHMDAIITAMKQLGFSSPEYGNSARTVDVADTTAVAFVQELVYKYMDYFAAKGCGEFNIGSDEYANDTGSPQFSALISGGYYDEFITYLNALADYACNKGMTPMAFNDGIYYNQNTSNGTLNENIMVCYWSSGWWGYDVASASYLANKGFNMINTHGDYYFVLTSSGITNPSDSVLNFDENTFMGSTVSDPSGSMFCIWCDAPGVATEQEVAEAARITLRKMAAAMQGTTSYSEDVVVGGFNEDGSINIVDTRSWTTVYAEDNSGISVSGYDLTDLTVVDADAPEIEGAVNVKAWDITPYAGTEKYTAKGTVKLPVPDGWNTNLLTGFYVENGAAVLVKGTYADGYYTFDMPHFSVSGLAELDYDHLIKLTIGESKTKLIENIDLTTNTYTPDPEGIANVTTNVHYVAGTSKLEPVTSLKDLVSGEKYVLVNKRSGHILDTTANYTNEWNGTTCLLQSDEKLSTSSPYWTITVDGSKYYFQNSNGSYMTIASNYSNLTTTQTALTMYDYGNETFGVAQNGYYLNDMGAGGEYAGGYNVWNDAGAPWYLYQIIETQASNGTDVTFTGTAVGETYVTINNEVYKIVVSYIEKELNIVVSGSKSDTQSATITGNPSYSVEGVVTATVSGDTVTFTAGSTTGTTVVTVGNTKYTVNVIEVDLDSVDPLKLEYWITNGRISDPVTDLDHVEIKASQEGIYSVNGVAVANLVPATGTKDNRTQKYWQSKLLNVAVNNSSASGTQEQTVLAGDDETLVETTFTHVRYWNGAWQVLVGTNWIDVDRTEVTVNTYDNQALTGTTTRETHQLVVYYMEVVDITNENGTAELHINSADWGTKGDSSSSWGYWPEDSRCSVTIQLVYENGNTNPSDESVEALDSKSIVYYLGKNGRGLGTMNFTGAGDYQIFKITAETGDMTSERTYVSNGYGVQITGLTWDDNEEVVWENLANPQDSVSIGNPTQNPTYEDPYDNLAWHLTEHNQNNAILIRVYVKAKVTEAEDTLYVHYIDKTANNLEFYTSEIPAYVSTKFHDGFALDTSTEVENDLVNNTVETSYGSTYTVNADLKSMTQIAAYYRYCDYTCVEATRSEDGKHVYLYYTFTPVVSFVVDFGLPVEIKPTNLNQQGYETETDAIKDVKVIGTYDTEAGTNAHAEYGTLSVSETTVTYTPTEILQGVDFFTIYVVTKLDDEDTTINEEAGIAYRVYVFPATTVYYEESFLLSDDATGWTATTATLDKQETAKLGGASADEDPVNNYGYDGAYEKVGTNSGYITGSAGAYTTFTFTGTGFELYGNSDSTSGYVTVYSQGKLSKLYMVNTILSTGDTAATNQQKGGTYYNLPFISETDLPYGTYTVQLKQTKGEAPIYIDGVRIINTIDESALTDNTNSVYYADQEDKPVFYEVRDFVLNALGIQELDESIPGNDSEYTDPADRAGLVDSVRDMAGQVYNAIAANGASAVIVDNSVKFNAEDVQDLLDNGPKNELYLYPGQTLVFNVTTDRVMQLGLKSPTGSAKFTLTVDGKTLDLNSLSTTVDMFYKIAEKGGTTHTVSITVTEGVLSVTDLKICDDPNATFTALTQEDIENVLLDMYGLAEEPVIYADATLNIAVNDADGNALATTQLTANGIEGAEATFAAADIQAAVAALELPDNYNLDDVTYSDVTVTYGSEDSVAFTAEKELTQEEKVVETVKQIFSSISNFFKKFFRW